MTRFGVSMVVRIFLGLVPLLLASFAAASDGPTVSEPDLLRRLDGDHPAVALAQSPLALAEAQRLGVRVLDNPTLEVGREDPGGPLALTEWTVSWQLPGASRSLDLAAADQSVEAAAARLDHQLRSTRLQARRDFARWALAHHRGQLLQTEASRLDSLAAREHSRAERGESSGLQARRLELAGVTLRAKVALADSELQEAGAAVRVWWPDLAPEARPELPPLPMQNGDDGADRSTHAHSLTGEHALVTASRFETEAAELALRASRRVVASPELSLGWQRQEAFQQDEAGPIVRLAWTLPLFDRRRSERAAAQAHLDRARADTAMTSRTIETRRQVAVQRLAGLLRETTVAKMTLDTGHDLLLSSETAFRYGELPLTDLLDIQRSMTETQLAWLELYGAALAAHRELDALAPAASPEAGSHTEPSPKNKESQP